MNNLRTRLLLLALEQRNQGNTRHLDDLKTKKQTDLNKMQTGCNKGNLNNHFLHDLGPYPPLTCLEAHTGDITDGMATASKSGNQHLVLRVPMQSKLCLVYGNPSLGIPMTGLTG